MVSDVDSETTFICTCILVTRIILCLYTRIPATINNLDVCREYKVMDYLYGAVYFDIK